MKTILPALIAVLGLGTVALSTADEIQFTTLPDAVRTTVVRQTRIPDYSRVARVVRDANGVYEVTVRGDPDNYVVYVDDMGRLVKEQTVAVPVSTGRVVTQSIETSDTPTVETFIRSLDSARYQLIEKKGDKEVYRDRTTGVKWVVKVERED